MSDILIEVEGGKSKRLLTAGKVCKDDIVVTATGGGGEVNNEQVDALMMQTLTEYRSDNATDLKTSVFSYNTALEVLSFPNMKKFTRSNALNGCTSLRSIYLPKWERGAGNDFRDCSSLPEIVLPAVNQSPSLNRCTSLKKVDLGLEGRSEKIIVSSMDECPLLDTLIIRNNAIATLSTVARLAGTAIENGTGFIYVPRALIEDYKVATNWVTFASQFRAIEDYPEICGGVEE